MVTVSGDYVVTVSGDSLVTGRYLGGQLILAMDLRCGDTDDSLVTVSGESVVTVSGDNVVTVSSDNES